MTLKGEFFIETKENSSDLQISFRPDNLVITANKCMKMNIFNNKIYRSLSQNIQAPKIIIAI